ncbi:hypothetical protein NESM_000133300 [Novymonas esmeraldas]|uniref:Uncharacterized protein n=1 Tax=Novymonas esmeraldas TaxID=1808958 RepID=A0AAW0F527_9TRYP
MQAPTERRLLVYQCGMRSVVSLSETRISSSCSPLARRPSASPTPLRGSLAGAEKSAAAGELTTLGSPCSSVTVGSEAALEDAGDTGGPLARSALSKAARHLPPPPPCSPTRRHDMTPAAATAAKAPALELSRQRGSHSLQGESPSLVTAETYSRSDVAVTSGSCAGHMTQLAEWAGSTTLTSPPPHPTCVLPEDTITVRDQCAATRGKSVEWRADNAGVPRDERTHTRARRDVDPVPSSRAWRDSSRRVSAVGAERVLFADGGGEDEETSTASHSRCDSPHHQEPATPSDASAAAPATGATLVSEAAFTPPRSPLSPHDSTTQCSSHERFSVHYAPSSPSCSAIHDSTPLVGEPAATSSTAAAANECASVPSTEDQHRTLPRSAHGLPPSPQHDHRERTPPASTFVAATNAVTPPTNTRAALPPSLEALLVGAVHTPTAHTSSSSAAAAAGAAVAPSPLAGTGGLATPTSLRTSWRGGRGTSASASWEGMARITGFPTPVRLSPIPTKTHAGCAVLCVAAEAATGRGTAAVTTGATTSAASRCVSAPASPALSAIRGELDECGAAAAALAPNELTLTDSAAWCFLAERREAAVRARAGVTQAAEWTENDVADCLTDAHERSTSSAACSASPTQSLACQTTRVWMSHPSERSQPCHTDVMTLPPPPPPPPTRPNSLRGSTVLGTATTLAGEVTFSTHSSVSRTAPRSPWASQDAVPALPSTTAVHPESVLQHSHGPRPQHHRRHSPDSHAVDGAAAHKSMRHHPTGRTAHRCAAETLNLGTPTASIIQCPAPALGMSCGSILMPPAVQYVEALPIPGLRRCPTTTASSTGGAQPAHLTAAVVKQVGATGTGTARSPRAERRHRGSVLLSPSLLDGDGGEDVETCVGDTGARIAAAGHIGVTRLPRVLGSPPTRQDADPWCQGDVLPPQRSSAVTRHGASVAAHRCPLPLPRRSSRHRGGCVEAPSTRCAPSELRSHVHKRSLGRDSSAAPVTLKLRSGVDLDLTTDRTPDDSEGVDTRRRSCASAFSPYRTSVIDSWL